MPLAELMNPIGRVKASLSAADAEFVVVAFLLSLSQAALFSLKAFVVVAFLLSPHLREVLALYPLYLLLKL